MILTVIMNDFECKKCHEKFSVIDGMPRGRICPNCGKKMRWRGQHCIQEEASEEQEKKFNEEWKRRVSNTSNRVTSVQCPYCHSMDTKKISGFSRGIAAGLLGVGSSSIGKQWHCNRCDSDF